MTRAEALAAVESALSGALAREDAARPCPTCCLAMFPRVGLPGLPAAPGETPWRPGLAWSEAARTWYLAFLAWEHGVPVDALPRYLPAGGPGKPLPTTPPPRPPASLYTPCPACHGTGLSDATAPLREALACLREGT